MSNLPPATDSVAIETAKVSAMEPTAAASGLSIPTGIHTTHDPDPISIQAKYQQERAKRVKPEGLSQYVVLQDLQASDKFKYFQADIWADEKSEDQGAKLPALDDGSRCKVLILGAGFGGLCFAVRLIQAGFDVNDIRLAESAGGFGGTWYWNRYPGLMCDIESYIYMPLLEETGYMPKHKYAYGQELREHASRIAEKWQLTDKTMFRVEIGDIAWDETEKEWIVSIVQIRNGQKDRTFKVRSQFVISASGLLNHPKLPGIPGLDVFKGHMFHTSRWDYSYTGGSQEDPTMERLKDKDVAIIGTGATAVQVVPHLAKYAKHLYVVQRTPSAVDFRAQRPTNPADFEQMSREKGWQKKRAENFNAWVSNPDSPPSTNMVADGWCINNPSFRVLIGMPGIVPPLPEKIGAHVMALHAADLSRQERIRRRCDELVENKATAEKLKPWYPSWCKRPCFHDEYLPAFNRPNVTLVDTDGRGVDALTEDSLIVTSDGQRREVPVDLLILSTGYRSPLSGGPAERATMTVTGRNGLTLSQKWGEGVGTLHGVVSAGFPNFFFPGPTQAGAGANYTFCLDQMAIHVAYIMAEASKTAGGSKVLIEPSPEGEQAWTMQILMRAAGFAAMMGCTPSYFNGEGEIDREQTQEEQMKSAKNSPWGEGMASYLSVIEDWRNKGNLDGLSVTYA